MKKIGVLLSCTPEYGGTYQYNLSILDACDTLPADAYDVVVYYVYHSWEHDLAAYRFEKQHVTTTEDLLDDSGCDLWIYPSQESFGMHKPVPVLATIHDLMHRYEPDFPEVSAAGHDEWREDNYRKICAYARGILVDSETGKKHVQESYEAEGDRLFVLPFIPPKYITMSSPSPDFDQKYHLPDKYIFYPAHFWLHKNHFGLLSAVNRLRDEHPDLRLILIGSQHNGYELVRSRIIELQLDSYVHIAGHVPNEDVSEFYRRARALVMPSFFGPTNIPQLEAFALGCPAAVSNVYGVPEQVGDAALMFDPHCASEMARCIKQLWTDDDMCRTLAERGRKKAKEWNQEHFNEKFQEIIFRLLD